MRARTAVVLVGGAALLGCSALLGVRDDVFFDENAEGGASSSGATSSSGAASSSGGSGDAGADGPVTCNADLQTSKEHCGRCGHGCGGGECVAGKCQPIQISSIAKAPLQYIAVGADHVFVSTLITLVTQEGGIWRIPKNGGPAELYAPLNYAGNMRILGDKLYFVVEDEPGDGGEDQTGGLYVCPTTGPAPCQPSRIAGADNPRMIAVDGTRVLFTDTAVGMRAFDTATGQTTTVNDFTAGRYLYVDGTAAFYNVTIFNSQPYTGRMIEIFPDGGYVSRHDYTKNNANAGTLVGTPEAIYVAAFEWQGPTSGGVIHRYPRVQGGLPCDYGGSSNTKRPFGITIDENRIWWTNLGVGELEPFTGGSLSTCELAGCCTTPETLWSGDGMPGAITNDSGFVYWANEGNGAVWKIAKP